MAPLKECVRYLLLQNETTIDLLAQKQQQLGIVCEETDHTCNALVYICNSVYFTLIT